MLNIALDVLFIVFIFWFALIGLRQGFIGMLGRLLATFAALILAFIFNGPLLELLYSLPWLNGVAGELAGRIMPALVFFLLFMILLFLIRLILQLISNVLNQLPVIGAFNRFAGFFAGIAYGMLIIAVALLVVTLAVPWLPEAAQAVSETALLSCFYNNNPLLLVF